MSFSELQKPDDIRLSNVFRHPCVRSLSPQDNADSKAAKNNFSFTNELKPKESIRNKIIKEECRNFFPPLIKQFLATINENLSLKTGTIFIKRLKLAKIYVESARCAICNIEFRHLKDHKHHW